MTLIIDFEKAVRARLIELAKEKFALQERVMQTPEYQVAALLKRMEEIAIEMSRLASRLHENEAPVPDVPMVPNVPIVSEPGSDSETQPQRAQRAQSSEDPGPEAA